MTAEIFEVTAADLTTPDVRAPFEIAYITGLDEFAMAKASVEGYPAAFIWLPVQTAHLIGPNVRFQVDGRWREEHARRPVVVRSAVS